MGRKTWVKPMTLVQKFEANEAVAAEQCFQVVCQSQTTCYNYSATMNPDEGFNPWHQKEAFHLDPVNGKHDGCKKESDNVFYFDGEHLSFYGNSGQVGNGEIDTIIDANNSGILGDAGDRVYWHTTEKIGAFTFVWNHWGKIDALVPGHPLRS